MHSRAVRISVAVALVLACIWLGYSSKAPAPNDLAVGFIGLTNNPGGSVYPRISVLGDGKGLYALFAVTNISRAEYIRFGIQELETRVDDGWRANSYGVFKSELGSVWSPGYTSVYAIPWPARVSAQTPWRLRLWVMREPGRLFISWNQRLGRDVFRPHGRHTITSDVVMPAPEPYGESGAEASDIQPDQ